MKRKFCLVPYVGTIPKGGKVFCVWIGESQRDQMAKAWIESSCALSGWYFKLWDGGSEDYIEDHSVLKPVAPCFNWTAVDIIYLTATDCYKVMQDDSLLNYQQANLVNVIRRQMVAILAPYILNPALRALARIVPFSRIRKYLSRLEGSDLFISLVYFGLILMLFLFSGWLEGRYEYGL